MVKSSPFLILFRCLCALSFRLVFWSSLLGRVKIGDRVMDLWSSQNRKQGHGWPTSHIAWGLSLVWEIRLDFIVELFPRRAAARETLAGVSRSLQICVECVIEFLRLECVTWNSHSSLSFDRGSPWVEEII